MCHLKDYNITSYTILMYNGLKKMNGAKDKDMKEMIPC
jgi:hypothetical protein